MNVNWEAAIQRWQSLNLSALYQAEEIHNRSFNLISSIISQKLHEALQTSTTSSTVSGTSLRTTTAIVTGSTLHSTQAVDAGAQVFASATPVNSVSWQTAFWTVAAIALNTCLQDCGRVCAIQKEFALLVRSSPFICLADALIILLQLLFFTLTKGLKSAIRIVALSRDQHSSQSTNDDTRPVQYIARGLLVTLAIIQTIKLFALSGVPWCQFFGACYLSSYIVNAILNVFGRTRPDIGAVGIPQQGSKILSRNLVAQVANLAVIAQLVAWTISLRGALPDDLLESWGTCGIFLHLIAGLLMLIPIMVTFATIHMTLMIVDIATILVPAGIVVYICYLHPRIGYSSFVELTASIVNVEHDTAAIGICSVSTLISLILHVCFYPFWASSAATPPLMDSYGQRVLPFLEAWNPYGLILVFIAISAALSHLVARIFLFGTLAKRLHLQHLSVASYMGSACLFLFVANVSFALIYFTVAYDPSTTNKPGWTENLGKFLL